MGGARAAGGRGKEHGDREEDLQDQQRTQEEGEALNDGEGDEGEDGGGGGEQRGGGEGGWTGGRWRRG